MRLDAQPRWWLAEHYGAMLGNGVATHVAFLSIGLPRLLPAIDGDALHYLGWFAPLVWWRCRPRCLLDRRWKPRTARAAARCAALILSGGRQPGLTASDVQHSAGCGRPNRYPCAYTQPIATRAWRWSSVSMPSATTSSPSE